MVIKQRALFLTKVGLFILEVDQKYASSCYNEINYHPKSKPVKKKKLFIFRKQMQRNRLLDIMCEGNCRYPRRT
jgi:hypothetical protein